MSLAASAFCATFDPCSNRTRARSRSIWRKTSLPKPPRWRRGIGNRRQGKGSACIDAFQRLQCVRSGAISLGLARCAAMRAVAFSTVIRASIRAHLTRQQDPAAAYFNQAFSEGRRPHEGAHARRASRPGPSFLQLASASRNHGGATHAKGKAIWFFRSRLLAFVRVCVRHNLAQAPALKLDRQRFWRFLILVSGCHWATPPPAARRINWPVATPKSQPIAVFRCSRTVTPDAQLSEYRIEARTLRRGQNTIADGSGRPRNDQPPAPGPATTDGRAAPSRRRRHHRPHFTQQFCLVASSAKAGHGPVDTSVASIPL